MVGSYPLLSQAPTPVEVELGCDKNTLNAKALSEFSLLAAAGHILCCGRLIVFSFVGLMVCCVR